MPPVPPSLWAPRSGTSSEPARPLLRLSQLPNPAREVPKKAPMIPAAAASSSPPGHSHLSPAAGTAFRRPAAGTEVDSCQYSLAGECHGEGCTKMEAGAQLRRTLLPHTHTPPPAPNSSAALPAPGPPRVLRRERGEPVPGSQTTHTRGEREPTSPALAAASRAPQPAESPVRRVLLRFGNRPKSRAARRETPVGPSWQLSAEGPAGDVPLPRAARVLLREHLQAATAERGESGARRGCSCHPFSARTRRPSPGWDSPSRPIRIEWRLLREREGGAWRAARNQPGRSRSPGLSSKPRGLWLRFSKKAGDRRSERARAPAGSRARSPVQWRTRWSLARQGRGRRRRREGGA